MSTSTSTATATRTFTRVSLIQAQVRVTMRRTTSISPDQLKKTFDTGIQNRWIKNIMVYAVDRSNQCKAQLTLEIDWDEYEIQMAQGRATVVVDGQKWQDNTAIELDEVIALFNKYVAEYSLETRWIVTSSGLISYDEWLRELGLVAAEEVKWEDGWSSPIPELPELRVGCYLSGI